MKTILGLWGAVLIVGLAGPARADDQARGWKWLAQSDQIQSQSTLWDDRFGDGKDRWKTGGVSQSVILPEHALGRHAWFAGRASALEINLRAVLMTPDDTANKGIDRKDRPYAQYAGLGVYLRSVARPRPLGRNLSLQIEDRAGVELGWQGQPLPLFELQKAVHAMTGTQGNMGNPRDTIGGEPLVNLEGRRSWRLHIDGPAHDTEIAPFIQGSLGMREDSLRAGADLLVGSALAGRTWGSEPATGAVIAGNSLRHRGFDWTAFVGGDVGYVAWDAFLGGGIATHGRKVARKELVGRARAGVFLDLGRAGIGFSLNWLSPEFETQPTGQLIGAIQFNYRF